MIKPEHGLVCRSSILALAVFFSFNLPGPAQDLEWIGMTVFRAATTNLDGAGIRVGQTEGLVSIPLAWAAYPVMHVAHGVGFGAGILGNIRARVRSTV